MTHDTAIGAAQPKCLGSATPALAAVRTAMAVKQELAVPLAGDL